MGLASHNLASRRAIFFYGFALPFLLYNGMATVILAFVFRLSGALLLHAILLCVLAGLALSAPGSLLAMRRFAKLESSLTKLLANGEGGFDDGSDPAPCGPPSGKPVLRDRQALFTANRLEGYPLFVASICFGIFSLVTVIMASTWLLGGDLLPAVVANYLIVGLSLALASSFPVFFSLHDILMPMRASCFACFGSFEGVRGVTMKARVLAMSLLLTLVFVAIAFTTAEVYTIQRVRDRPWPEDRSLWSHGGRSARKAFTPNP